MKNSITYKVKKYLHIILDSKKIIKNEVIHIKESELYEYCIEKLDYKNNILNIKGWIFNKDTKIDSLRLLLINENQEHRIILVNNLIERQDVYDVYKCKNSLSSGFCYKIRIENVNNALIYLEVDEKERIFIYEIKNYLFEKIKFYRKNLTFQNIKKIILLIKKNEIFTLKESAKKVVIEEVNENVENINLSQFLQENIIESIEYPNELYKLTIDIIIPVYNGYEYLEKLFKTISYTKMNYRIIVINDKSTDTRIKEFLEKYKEDNDHVILLENKENLGFVKTVNKGLSIAINHVALLNTDIELPNMWLERLMTPIILNDNIATSTPFTNCGTICSFPEFCKDNKIFEDLDLNYIDEAFQTIKPSYTTLPTGVGFCMGINKKALNEVGLLDDDTFGKGYGEENDWCQRAIKAGYKNVHVENLYVYHKHGGSFLSEEKKRLLENNLKLLSQKHANYLNNIENFCSSDPVKNVRNYVVFNILSSKSDNISVYFDHDMGGGATRYLEAKVKKSLLNGQSSIIIRHEHLNKRYFFNYKYKNYSISYYFIKFSEIIDVLSRLNVKKIYINELVNYPNLYEILEKISEFKERNHVDMIMLLHDFFSICPTINLLDDKGCYCNIPNIKTCEKCLKNNQLNNYFKYESMEKWNNEWRKFLNKCDDIIAFSQSSKMLLKKKYDLNKNIVVIPHEVNYIIPLERKEKTTNTLNIGLLGLLNYHKGLKKIKELLETIEKDKLDINIILIGYTLETINHKNFRQTGNYTSDKIMKLVLDNDIDLFFISSIWPETFSYTTQEVINMNLPVVSFNFGAQAEKIRIYNKGLLLKSFNSKEILDEIIEFSNTFTY
jgi:GT2 family glycosyltransferase